MQRLPLSIETSSREICFSLHVTHKSSLKLQFLVCIGCASAAILLLRTVALKERWSSVWLRSMTDRGIPVWKGASHEFMGGLPGCCYSVSGCIGTSCLRPSERWVHYSWHLTVNPLAAVSNRTGNSLQVPSRWLLSIDCYEFSGKISYRIIIFRGVDGCCFYYWYFQSSCWKPMQQRCMRASYDSVLNNPDLVTYFWSVFYVRPTVFDGWNVMGLLPFCLLAADRIFRPSSASARRSSTKVSARKWRYSKWMVGCSMWRHVSENQVRFCSQCVNRLTTCQAPKPQNRCFSKHLLITKVVK